MNTININRPLTKNDLKNANCIYVKVDIQKNNKHHVLVTKKSIMETLAYDQGYYLITNWVFSILPQHTVHGLTEANELSDFPNYKEPGFKYYIVIG